MGDAMMLKNRVAVTAGFLTLLVGACSACAAESAATHDSPDDLPSVSSLEEARQAVSGQLECLDDPPASTAVMGDAGQIPAESVKCTQTVEIFYFDSLDARDEAYALMAGAAQPDGSVYFAEGRNWFVVDYSEVGVGTTAPEPMDLSVLSEPLGTRFTEVK
ncbi:hypothetical protein KKR91_01555 [Arthrobacter jiangjiafuii]|uniref:Lipoprotein n=1 Tax=Arthrobacter jiangjiafuii TaxID=2817475 RepID=A0A975QZY1_9MICC|nr:hypothetical protein [Arthrobacter jiangjiafuii]MBP3044805.1 hypothetical protein [Arthrobacter jiangjiafuii]QWC10370.1 hypothetical protein KKR91_01555 [Arthrobacter jiangjiafuii]